MSAVEPQVTETPAAVETPSPAPAPAPAPAAPAKPVSLHDTVAAAVEKSSERGKHAQHQPRKETGQFAGPPQFPKPPSATTTATPSTDVAAPQRPTIPATYKQDLRPHWDSAPLELLNAIVEREEMSRRGVEPLKTAKQQYDDLMEAFKPYEHMLRAENATPKAAIQNLMQTAAILRTGTPEQKAHAAATTLRQFGIPLEAVQALLQSGATPATPAIDPHVQLLSQQVQQLTQQQQAIQDAKAQAAVQQFMDDPAHKHFAAVADRMMVLLQTPKVLGEGVEVLSEAEKLKLAYEAAIWQDPAIRQQIMAEQQAKEAAEREAATAQARNSAVQVTGAPRAAPASQVNPRDLQAVVAQAIRRNQR
jgi:hypothetical protein